MDFESNQWNIADEEFSLWLNGNIKDVNIDLTDILKSTFLVFREKQFNWLEQFCHQSFNFLIENKYKTVDDFLYESDLRFCLKRLNKAEQLERDKLKKEENERLINGILSGDQKVFNRFYEHEFPKVVRFILENSGNLESAKDIFQDTLVVFIEKVYRKDLDLTCSIGTYLYSICRNLWLDQLRKDKLSISLTDHYNHSESLMFVSSDLAPDIYENVNGAIEKLGDPCKQLLESYYYKSLNWDEIASSLGYANAASARNQKYKCLERIRKTLNVEVD